MGYRHLGRKAEQAAARGGSLTFEGKTYEAPALFERSRRLAGGLRAAGLEPGDRVVIMMANCPEVGMTYNACWWGGLVVTPLIFLASAPELQHVLTDSGAKAVVTTPEFVSKVAETGVAVSTFVVGEESFSALESGAPAALTDRADDDLAALLYTGGTTGRSKGVMLSHQNLYSVGEFGCENRKRSGDEVESLITALPLAHVYGLLLTLIGMFVEQPPRTVLQRWFDPGTFLDLAQEHRIEAMSVVPSMLQMMLATPLEERDLSGLQIVLSGGAPLPPAIAAEWERRVPSSIVLEGYGLTEGAGVVTSSSRQARRTASVGRPVVNVEVAILDPGGDELAAGEDGEICVRAATVMAGYWNAPEATAATLRDGWLHTGDVGHFDADGFLFVVDRMKDLIIRRGFNVYPRDVEDALMTHPDVTQAAVVGRPDERQGEEIVAIVAVNPGASVTEADLIDYARERIGRHKYPRAIRVVPAVPLTSVGKTDRKAVRQLLSEQPAS
jgi:long-chain acyl-CoA synthetase